MESGNFLPSRFSYMYLTVNLQRRPCVNNAWSQSIMFHEFVVRLSWNLSKLLGTFLLFQRKIHIERKLKSSRGNRDRLHHSKQLDARKSRSCGNALCQRVRTLLKILRYVYLKGISTRQKSGYLLFLSTLPHRSDK